jgi:hypothetical protein
MAGTLVTWNEGAAERVLVEFVERDRIGDCAVATL